MGHRDEEFEILIEATPAEVWRMLTTPDGLASWFGTRGTIDLKVDGERTVGWGDTVEMNARITDIEPGRRIRLVYLADGVETGAEEWLVTTRGDTVRVRLINSMIDDGIDDWDGFYGDIRRGWRLFLASLKYALESATTSARLVRCAYVPAPNPRGEIWKSVVEFLDSSDLPDGMGRILADPPHSLLLAGTDRSLLVDIEGADDHQVLYMQAACHGVHDDGWIDTTLGSLRSGLEHRISKKAN